MSQSSLLDTILSHAEAYTQGRPVIPDEEYDALVRLFIEQGGNSDLLPLDASIGSSFPKARHLAIMGSLENIFSEEGLENFVKSCGPCSFVLEAKVDGAGLELRYEDSVLVAAITRGRDGITGELVTRNAFGIFNAPYLLPVHVPGILEVRGDVVMMEAAFEEWNYLNEYKTARNAASGSLRLLDSKEVALRPLVFIAHSFGNLPESFAETYPNRQSLWEFLESSGFLPAAHIKTSFSPEEVVARAKTYLEVIEKLPYAADGVVVKVQNLEDEERLGWRTRTPRWATAFKKKQGDTGTSLLKDIVVQVGRTGQITPVAVLEPVTVGGVVITSAQLHNIDFIETLDIRPGDSVLVYRAGEVIPKISGVAARGGGSAWEMPKHCPSCGDIIVRGEDEAAHYCHNVDCLERKIQRLLWFCGKDGLDVFGLGEKSIRQLHEAGLLNTVPDIFSLPKKTEEIALLKGFAQQSAKKLAQAIEKAVKDATLDKIISVLGIRNLGREKSRLVARTCLDLEDFSSLRPEQLPHLEGFGPKLRENFAKFCADKSLQGMGLVHALLDIGFNPKPAGKTEVCATGPLLGKTILFTGTLSASRSVFEDKAKQAGAKVSSGVNKALDYLVVGEKPGSKLQKAQALGVKILDETAFFELLSQ